MILAFVYLTLCVEGFAKFQYHHFFGKVDVSCNFCWFFCVRILLGLQNQSVEPWKGGHKLREIYHYE